MKLLLTVLGLSAFLLGAADSQTVTDAQGKKWIVRQTPFGVSRVEDRPAAAEPAKPADPSPLVTATEDGDKIRFQRPSPFGVMQWTVKKSELNDMERAVWNRDKPAAGKKD